MADTCYVWWVDGALALLGRGRLLDRAPARRFLLDKTQHLIGGFAKHPGSPPDVYHAYLGLAALATMAGQEEGQSNGSGDGQSGESGAATEEGLGRFDPRLCVGAEAAARIRRAREALLASGDNADEDPDTDPEEWPLFRARRARAAGQEPREG